MKAKLAKPIAALALCLCAGLLPAYNPPSGGEALYDWYSPLFLSGGPSASESQGPASDAINPAASAAQQRFTLDLSYIALANMGAAQGLGSVINLQASMPVNYGVWGTGARFFIVPEDLASIPLGSAFSARGSFAKDLYPNLWAGIGVQAAFGRRDSYDWSLGADLGLLGQAGSIGVMRNFRWGAVLAGLGKWYSPGSTTSLPQNQAGALDNAFPAPFTAKGGIGFDWVKNKSVRLSSTFDLAFPFFQNVLFDTGLTFAVKEAFAATVGWGINVREIASGVTDSYLPSFGFKASIPITTTKKSDSFLAKQGWSQSEIQPVISAHPMDSGLWALGAGVSLPLGVIDRKGPKIAVTYPETAYDAYYLSPNADGKNDELVLPVNIKDERYVMGYNLKILDASGALVREIRNKESRPENQGLKGFFSRLAYRKAGVPVPPELKWDGRTDSGQLAPDGAYTFVLTAEDDNGNSGASETLKINVDSTPPAAAVVSPADSNALVFSPDGDGSKDSLTVKASGSVEDDWVAQIRDAAGNPVRSFPFKGAALGDIVWDGKNDAGQMVPDGVYKAYFGAEDRAGNRAETGLDNIIVDTRQPPVSLAIDSAFFSPNGDDSRDSILLSPGVPVRTGLAEWMLSVKDKAGIERWKVSGAGSESLRESYAFDGKDESGKVLPEGSYQAFLAVRYVNGHKPSVASPAFVLDVTAPKATVSADLSVFSPNGDGKQDEVSFSQSASEEDLWTGEVVNDRNEKVLVLRFAGKVDPKLSWDGSTDAGARAPDGRYRYRLWSTDKAGNTGSSNVVELVLDTEKKSVLLSVDLRAFSPNGDGQKDRAVFSPTVQKNDDVIEWRFRVQGSGGEDARFQTAKGRVPEKISWDGKADSGKVVADGTYAANLWVKYRSGDEVTAQAPSLTVDTIAPSIEVSAEQTLFSPNGDGRADFVLIRQSKASDDGWEGAVLDSAGKTVRDYAWKDSVGDIKWDGADNAGNKLPDGKYRYLVAATDRAGNRTQKSVEGIVIDTRETSVFVTASRTGFSPNGDGKFDDLRFSFIVKLKDGVSDWSFVLKDSAGAARKTWTGKGADSIPASLPWDGKGDDGKLAEGSYSGSFAVNYAKGDRPEATTPAILLDVSAPEVRLRPMPAPFSPDNDGVDDEVTIALSVNDASDVRDWKLEINEAAVEEAQGADKQAKTRLFMRYEGLGKPAERLTWDGKSLKGELVEAATDYPYAFTVSDSLGNSRTVAGVISVDVLVVRDGDRLKIKVPSIVFRANFADFKDLGQETVDKNYAVLKRIAEILNKYKSYRVTVEGHANSIGKIYGYSADKVRKEEESEVLPLSESRARAVLDFLVQFGVDAKRLSAKGLGSAESVVDPKDADNRWKNRRVEFILEK